MGKNKSKHRFYTDVSIRRSALAKIDNYIRQSAAAEKERRKNKTVDAK